MKKKYYPIFKIDVCFSPYAIDYILVGAKDVDDLIAHIKTDAIEGIDLTDDYIYSFSNLKTDYDGRIKVMDNSFTDKPYVVLGEFRYYE